MSAMEGVVNRRRQWPRRVRALDEGTYIGMDAVCGFADLRICRIAELQNCGIADMLGWMDGWMDRRTDGWIDGWSG